MTDQTLGARLRSARKAAGLTMRDVETRGFISKGFLSAIESDESIPGLLRAAQLARLYCVGLSDLVGKDPVRLTDEGSQQ